MILGLLYPLGATNLHSHTGAMVGLCSQDMTGDSKPADFDCFEYKVEQ
ncbi:MAG: hypothetical protein GX915_03555 [Clostridiales bacterium]|nr:hypothetical protein [Clostridiales bacterium]